jgi:hypothetical protein
MNTDEKSKEIKVNAGGRKKERGFLFPSTAGVRKHPADLIAFLQLD